MFDDLLAGDIVPIFEPIAAVNFAGRKQRLHRVLRYPDGASSADGANPSSE
jgi:hypothetical protein